jgi:hypothetical protein
MPVAAGLLPQAPDVQNGVRIQRFSGCSMKLTALALQDEWLVRGTQEEKGMQGWAK